jgi:myo-inositol-1(or 4)-monophosphatase
MNIDKVEEVARTAIFQVGSLIRAHIGTISSTRVETKGPSDYVTDIDRKSEAIIMDLIGEHFPDHHIVSEETAGSGLEAGTTWVIDPLDGTTNFIHGFPYVAVSIAVCTDEKPVLGLVLDPVRQELFSARKGGGAYLNDAPIRVNGVERLQDALIATGFPFRRKFLLEAYLSTFKNIFGEVSGIRRAGAAALDLAYLAAGRVDGFWEIGLAPWDIAAGSLLVTEAGGTVNDFWGNGAYLRNGHIVAGAPAVYPFLQEQVRSILAPALESE